MLCRLETSMAGVIAGRLDTLSWSHPYQVTPAENRRQRKPKSAISQLRVFSSTDAKNPHARAAPELSVPEYSTLFLWMSIWGVANQSLFKVGVRGSASNPNPL